MRALVLAVRWAGPLSVLIVAGFFDAAGAAVMMLVCLGITLMWRARLPVVLELGTGLLLLVSAWSSVLLLYEKLRYWDLVIHFAATAVLAELAFRALERWGGLVVRSTVAHALVVASLGVALAVIWEFNEFIGHAVVDPRVQIGYEDTMGDLAAGTAGALLAGVLGGLARRRVAPTVGTSATTAPGPAEEKE